MPTPRGGHTGLGVHLKEKRTTVFTGTQTSQYMNQGSTYTERHLHTHELSVCARKAALLALKTRGQSGLGRSVTANQWQEWDPGALTLDFPISASPPLLTLLHKEPGMEISACSLLLLQEPMQAAAYLPPMPTFTSQQGHPEPRWNTVASFNHLPWVLIKNLQERRRQHPSRTLDKYSGNRLVPGPLLPNTALFLLLKTGSSN